MRLAHASFPRRFPAAGLLILRALLGAVAEGQGWRLLSGPAEVLGAGFIVLGGALQLGALTSIAAGLLGLAEIVRATGGMRGLWGTESPAMTVALVGVCVVVVLTGPGAHSLDARL